MDWLLMKRDLYERPGHMGYTGIRDNAGRFTEDDAKSSVGDGQYGVTMIRLEDAPEFTNSCFDDLARDHLRKKLATLAAGNDELSRECETWRDLAFKRGALLDEIGMDTWMAAAHRLAIREAA